MGKQGLTRRLAAIFAADMVGYSRLMEADEEGTIARQNAHREEFVNPKIAEHDGRIVKLMGDGMLVEFASVLDAVRCAIDVQNAIAANEAPIPEDRRILYRVGINLGDIVVEGDDILGDGVNVAARIEALAPPGGIGISKKVHDEIKRRLDVAFSDAGEHVVKNISKPVHIWHWHTDLASATKLVTSDSQDLPDKPSIAVLPFRNRSADPEQEYFSTGIAEDITTRLSKVSSLFVIAFNSSAIYTGKSVAARQVSAELGVQYVVDGSVRKAGNMVRISAELIDGTSGEQVWAEHYDRELTDIFALQDEVTEEVVAALSVKLTPDERRRVRRARTSNIEAHDLFLRGREKRAQQAEQTNAEAKALFEDALEADPQFSAAAAYLSLTYGRDYANQWTRPAHLSLELQVHWAERAVELDEHEPLAHGVLAVAYLWVRRHDGALASAKRALELDPNSAFAYMALGWTCHFSGEQERAIELLEKSMQLDPHYPDYYLHFLAQAYFQMGLYDDATALLKRRLEQSPNSDMSRVLLAAAYGWTGRLDEARSEWRQALAINPQYSLKHRRDTLPYKDASSFERIVEGLAKAGLPS
jgi:TolB-like protein/Flp pilus assembly protein TadD